MRRLIGLGLVAAAAALCVAVAAVMSKSEGSSQEAALHTQFSSFNDD